MNEFEAIEVLKEFGSVPVMEGSLAYTKELRNLALEAGIAAAIVRPPRRGGG